MPDRLHQEIEELLARLDTFPPPRSPWQKARDSIGSFFRNIGAAFGSLRLPSISAGQVLLFAIVLVVIGYLGFHANSIGRWLVVSGIFLFIAAFVFSLRRQSHPAPKVWRDRPLDLRTPSNYRRRSWWDRWRTRR